MDTPLLTTPAPGLTSRWELSAPESYVLLHGPRADSVEAFKKGLLELAARGVLAITTYDLSRFFWFPRRETAIRSGPNDFTTVNVGPPLRRIHDVYRHAEAHARWGGAHIQDLGRSARMIEMPLMAYSRQVVIPSLVERGLLQPGEHRVLGLFPRATYVETPSGLVARAELERLMRMAERDLADAVTKGPKQALALVGTLGAAVFLMDPLFPELARLGQMLSEDIGEGLRDRIELSLPDLDFSTFTLRNRTFADLGGPLDATGDMLHSAGIGGSDHGDGGAWGLGDGGGWGDGGGGDGGWGDGGGGD